jgi:hypothetical protein
MDLNFPVFATGVRIFRASNDVGSWVHTNTRKNMDPGPTSLLALKIRTPVANTGKLGPSVKCLWCIVSKVQREHNSPFLKNNGEF